MRDVTDVARLGRHLGVMAVAAAVALAAAPPASADDASARQVLKSMSDYMGSQKSLSARIEADLDIITTDIEKLQPAASEYAASRAPYEAWFKKQVLEICGVDANTQPLGPECTMVFDSTAG